MAAIQVEEDQQEEDGGDVIAAMAAKKWPYFKQGQPKGQQAARKGGKSKGLCWAHQKYMERTATDVLTRRTAPGRETR